jgi:hypothetical protein
LGCVINVGDNFSFSAKNDLRSFYCSVNSILTVSKCPNEQISMFLIYANCVPILIYASEVKCFSASGKFLLSIDGKVSVFYVSFGYSDLYTLFSKRHSKFEAGLSHIENSTLRLLYSFLAV